MMRDRANILTRMLSQVVLSYGSPVIGECRRPSICSQRIRAGREYVNPYSSMHGTTMTSCEIGQMKSAGISGL